jgi:hypothetical protein
LKTPYLSGCYRCSADVRWVRAGSGTSTSTICVAELSLPQCPGKTFKARVATRSHAIDANARTLLVELNADNPRGLLEPGAFRPCCRNSSALVGMCTTRGSAGEIERDLRVSGSNVRCGATSVAGLDFYYVVDVRGIEKLRSSMRKDQPPSLSRDGSVSRCDARALSARLADRHGSVRAF